MYSKAAYDSSLWGWQATDGENEKIFLTSPIMFSGNVASAMNPFSNTDGGCLENHLQFMTFTLADRAWAMSIIAVPSAVAIKLHGCHGDSSGGSTGTGYKVAPKSKGAIDTATTCHAGYSKRYGHTTDADQVNTAQETNCVV
jgi:hypothetical protein